MKYVIAYLIIMCLPFSAHAFVGAGKFMMASSGGTSGGGGGGDTAPSGAVAFWKADSTTLTNYNATDGSTVTLIGSPSYVTGHDGNGITFTGTQSARFTVSSGNTIPTIANGYIEFWIKASGSNSSNDMMMVSYETGYLFQLYVLQGETQQWRFKYYGDTFSLGNSVISVFDNNWHKVHFQWISGGTCTLTIDGANTYTAAIANGTMPWNSGPLYVGNTAGGTKPTGATVIIDSVAVGQ